MKKSNIKNFCIDDEHEEKLLIYMNYKNIKNKSLAIRSLIDSSLEEIDYKGNIVSLHKELESIKTLNFEIISLLKQFYSDMQIENVTNINESIALKKIYDKRRLGYDSINS